MTFLESLIKFFKKRDFYRYLPLILSILSVVFGVITYVVFSSTEPGEKSTQVLPFVYTDLVLLLLLAVVIAKRLVDLSSERRQNIAGSKLQSQIILLFGFVSVIPAIFVALFAAFFFNISIQSWFGKPVKSAIEQAREVAEAYMVEHKRSISNDARAIVLNLRPYVPAMVDNSDAFSQALNAEAALRGLGEVLVFNGDKQVIARSFLTFSLEFEKVLIEHFEKARNEELVIIPNDKGDRVRALIKLDPITDTYLYIGKFVDNKVLNYVNQTKGAVADYNRLEAEKTDLQITFVLFFFLIAILLLLGAIWLGMTLSSFLVTPIKSLITASEAVSSGNLSVQVSVEENANDEISRLAIAFNTMTKRLHEQQQELISANNQIDRRRQIIETIISKISAGVIGLDQSQKAHLLNERACELLYIDSEDIIDKKIAQFSPEFGELVNKALETIDTPINEQISITKRGIKRILQTCVVVEKNGKKITGFIITFDDITDLISAQRKAAWSDVARRIAHEIKNPLTPIQLSAERLKRRYSQQITNDQETFQSCIDTIIRQVTHIGKLVGEFSAFARMPDPVMLEQSFDAMCHEIIIFHSQAHPEISFNFKVDQPIKWVFDEQQFSQVLNNLLQNSINALRENEIKNSYITLILFIDTETKNLILIIEDNGPGFPEENKARLIEPYVTLRTKGTGLGLAIVAKIVQDHRGTLELSNNPSGGAKLVITLPKT